MTWLRRAGVRNLTLWAAELVGVALLAGAVATLWLPGAAAIGGLYLILVANTTEGNDAGTR